MGGIDSIECERSLSKIFLTVAVVFVMVATVGVAALVKPAADGGNGVQSMSAGNRALRIGWVDMRGQVSTLNPLQYTTGAEWAVIWPCYSTLLAYDENSNVMGGLAMSWTMSEDGLSWSFKLYQTATFYDRNNPSLAVPVTARDVIYTFNLIQNETLCNLHGLLPEVGGAPVIQSMTWGPTVYDLQITLSSPYALFCTSLLTIPILPRYIWIDYYDPDSHHKAWNWNNIASGVSPCVGSGFLYYNQAGLPVGGTIELGRNPTWFGIEEHGWKLRCNKVVYYSELSPMNALTDFQNGVIDIMEWCTPDQFVNSIPGIPGAILQTSNSGFVYEYNANQMTDALRASLKDPFTRGSNNQLLLDPVVKEALAMTVDRQSIVDSVLLGLGAPADSLVPTNNPYHYTYGSDPSDDPVEYDPATARSMLNAAGWTYDVYGSYNPSATPLCKFGGTEQLTFRFYTLNTGLEWDSAARLLADSAWLAGIDLWSYYSIKSIGEMNSIWFSADYDVWLWNWVFAPGSDVSTDILWVMTTDAIGTWSDVFYSNATFDNLFEQSLVTIDSVQRKVITDEMQRMVYEDHGCQAVAYKDDLFAMRSSAPDYWSNWGNWSSNWVLEPSQAHPWLYTMIRPADNPPPYLTGSPSYDGLANESLALTASATDNSGNLEYRWIFGDGGKSSWSTTPDVAHVYSAPGNYTATVIVVEADSLDQYMTSATTVVHITERTNHAPTIDSFTVNATRGCIGWNFEFSCSASDADGDALELVFDFGDGTTWTTSAASPAFVVATHAYSAHGSYNASVAVSDGIAPAVGAGPYTVKVFDTTFRFILRTGWNLISLPLVDHNLTARTFGLMTGDVVVRWNSWTKTYDSYIVGGSPLPSDFPLEKHRGYWIYSVNNKSLVIYGNHAVGQQQFTVQVPVGGGWALIGFASLSTTRHASDVPPMASGMTIATIARYNPGYGYQTYIPGLPPSDFPLVPGEGYWIWVTGSGWITYNP